jgi:TPR repeat protein
MSRPRHTTKTATAGSNGSWQLGVPKDYERAAAWYRKAAEQGFAKAQFRLGSLYSEGRGVLQDYSEAYFWLNLATAGSKQNDQERYAKARDEAAAKLTPADLSSVQKQAAEWFTTHHQTR